MSVHDGIILILFGSFVTVLAGWLLIVFSDLLKTQRMKKIQNYVHEELLPDIQKTVMDVMDDAMKSIPYKIMDAKKVLKESDM